MWVVLAFITLSIFEIVLGTYYFHGVWIGKWSDS